MDPELDLKIDLPGTSPLLAIKLVRAIDAAATCSSLTAASERLHTSLSSLSRHIAQAERILGRRLFQRGWTGLEATSEGEVVVAHCRRMMSNIEAVQAAIGAGSASPAMLGSYLTWEGLAATDAVRLTGSVSAAAAYLGITQPDVSRAVSRLSAATGRPLFRRVRTGMEATGQADLLSDLHGKLRADMALLPEQLDALSGEVTGRVAVGLLPFSEQDVVVKMFGELLGRYPHVRLRAVTGSYAALTDALRRGELDFTIGILRSPSPFDDVEEARLHTENFAVVVRAGHRFAQAEPRLDELARASWMVAPHGTPSRAYFESWLLSRGTIPPAQTCEIVTFFLAEQMLLQSDVVGLLTYSDRKRAVVQPALKILPVALPDSRCTIGLTYRRRSRLTVPQQAFKDMLLQHWQTDRSGLDGATRVSLK